MRRKLSCSRAGCTWRSGCTTKAGERFERLLTNDVPTGVRNRAWFYLAAGVVRGGGYLERAERGVCGKGEWAHVPRSWRRQKGCCCFGNVLMHEDATIEAIRLLSSWAVARRVWSAYARLQPGGGAGCVNGRLNDADPVPQQRRHHAQP